MGIKGVGRFFKTVGGAIGGFFETVFSGIVHVFIEDFEEVAHKIVSLLFYAAVPGAEKLRMAFEVLKGYALVSGKKFILHAARLLIELEVTKAKGDDLEKVIDEGLELARQAVAAINDSDLTGDEERLFAAMEKLRHDLVSVGKEWLTAEHLLRVLIELAVSAAKK